MRAKVLLAVSSVLQQLVTRIMEFRQLLSALLAMGLSGSALCQSDDSPISTSVHIADLSHPVEILSDRWGIAHIYAQTEEDLFFAQGYNVARNRLFQLEIWRIQASGTAAQVFGRRELKRDIGARLHRYRGNLSKELNHYHPRGEAIVNAFVRGINAYIAQTERDPKLLPMEFELLGIKPQRWTAEIVISRHQALLLNITTEVRIARLLSKVGVERILELYAFQGGEPTLTPDPALDLGSIPETVLDLYSAFRRPMTFVPEQVVAGRRNDRASYERHISQRTVDSPSFSLSLEPNSTVGSNNWVIHGSRTMGSYPILANDPHRVLTIPSLRHWVHLVGPGWNVIGAGEPALPGVSIGHNEYGAWGLTVFGNDTDDLYVYDTNPANANEYRYRGKWEAMRVVKDSIPVKGEAAAPVEYKYTRHGPVLFENKEKHKAYALRAAWMQMGSAPYLASLRVNQSRSWQEFREVCAFNYIPSENMVWADRKGHIGYQATGIQPRRRNWSGLLPVPGDGRYEWDGFFSSKDLPSEHDPARGYIATANNFLFPIDYRFPEAMHFLWVDPYRFARISEVLGSGRLFNVAEVMRLQNDDLSIPARELVPLLVGLPLEGTSAAARDLVLRWDFVLNKDSVPAGIYAMWERRLLQNFSELVLQDAKEAVPDVRAYLSRVVDQLMAPNGLFGTDPVAGRDQFILRSFNEAIAELMKRFGPDMQAWKYGQEGYHHVVIEHPLSAAVSPELRKQLDIGPAARGGAQETVSATGSNDRQTGGGSFKIIVDTESWDRSVGQNTPGQSGNPDSPHYRDLFELWTQGKYFPVLYSRSKIEAATSERLLLTPSSDVLP